MNPLERTIRDRIKADGPITVEDYMEACNGYYYATRMPFGSAGDFTTAPEISQMFGEMIGGVLADCWTRAGAPSDTIYVELGPGRGTLTRDALRLLRGARFMGKVHFVETSPILRNAQALTVADAQWHDRIDDLPKRPMLLVANEFLDALPVRQLVGGIERRVTVAGHSLVFDRDGEIVEQSPAREAAVTAIARHIVAHGGAALILDYGHEQSAPGETLQAVRAHSFSPVLLHPGSQDLTAHVDFEAVGRAAIEAGARITRVARQGDWLIRLGIESRAQALSRGNPERANELAAALRRLVAPDEMGTLFKVMALHSPDWPAPAGFA